MSHDYVGPKVYKVIKHEQPGTGFFANTPHYNWTSDRTVIDTAHINEPQEILADSV